MKGRPDTDGRTGTRILLAAVVLELGLALFDALNGRGIVSTSLLLLPVALTAIAAGPRETWILGGLAASLAAAAGAWNDTFGTDSLFVVPLSVVTGGSIIAVAGSKTLARARRGAGRLELLTQIGELVEQGLPYDRLAQEVVDMLVPAVADVVLVDALRESGPELLGVRVAGRDGTEIEPALRRRRPPASGMGLGPKVAIGGVERLLIAPLPRDIYRNMAATEEDLPILERLRLNSAVVVPIQGGDEMIGALCLANRAGRPALVRGDSAYARAVADRVALALEISGLRATLRASETRQATVLRNLDEAITVQEESGRVIYLNRAAVELLELDSPARALEADPGEVRGGFQFWDEQGREVEVDRLPGRRVLSGESDAASLLVRSRSLTTGRERWVMIRSNGSVGEDGGRIAVNVMQDVTEARRSEFAQQMLAESGRILAGSLDYHRTLQQMVELSVPALADWCHVGIPREGFLEPVALAHVDPKKLELAQTLAERYRQPIAQDSPVARVLGSGESVLEAEVADDELAAAAVDAEHLQILKELQLGSYVVVPLLAAGRVLGTLTMIRTRDRVPFDSEDLALIEQIGRRSGVALENARLYEERSRIAGVLQRELQPDPLPQIPGWELAGLYRPAGDAIEAGGDFYDAFEVPGGWYVLVGDVCGQGAEAAAITALCRHSIRTAAQMGASPVECLAQLNTALVERGNFSLCTAVLARLPADAGPVTIANGGHPAPLLLTADGHEPIEIRSKMLGVTADAEFAMGEIEMALGDALVLYTDGVLDARGPEGMFGPDRLVESVSAASGTADRLRSLVEALHRFEDGTQRDDNAIVIVERCGAPLRALEPALAESEL